MKAKFLFIILLMACAGCSTSHTPVAAPAHMTRGDSFPLDKDWRDWNKEMKLRWMRHYKRSQEAVYLSSMLKERIVAQFPNPNGVDMNAWNEIVQYSRIANVDSGYFYNSGHVIADNLLGRSLRHSWKILYKVTPRSKSVVEIEIKEL